MRSKTKSFNFFFDFLSPYSYLAWCWIREHKSFLEASGKLLFTPVNLAPLIHAHGTLGPAEIEAKRNYLMRDCLRKSAVQGIDFKAPSELPFNALYALRISLACVSGDRQFDVIDLFYRSAWELGENLGDDEHIFKLLDSNNFPAAKWLELVGDKQVRRELKLNSKLALEKGLFGLPSFVVESVEETELFWGSDSLEFLKLYIKGEDPLNIESLNQFKSCYKEL